MDTRGKLFVVSFVYTAATVPTALRWLFFMEPIFLTKKNSILMGFELVLYRIIENFRNFLCICFHNVYRGIMFIKCLTLNWRQYTETIPADGAKIYALFKILFLYLFFVVRQRPFCYTHWYGWAGYFARGSLNFLVPVSEHIVQSTSLCKGIHRNHLGIRRYRDVSWEAEFT